MQEYFLRALSMAPPPDMGPLATLDTARTADWANRALNSHTSLPKDPDANGLSNDDTSGVIGGVSMIFMVRHVNGPGQQVHVALCIISACLRA